MATTHSQGLGVYRYDGNSYLIEIKLRDVRQLLGSTPQNFSCGSRSTSTLKPTPRNCVAIAGKSRLAVSRHPFKLQASHYSKGA